MSIASILLRSLSIKETLSIEKTDKINAVGIDLGTTFCCVSHFTEDGNEYLEDIHGNYITPSVVVLTKEEGKEKFLVGYPAKNDISDNPNKFWDSKRLIGREFKHPKVQTLIKNYPFKVALNNKDLTSPAFVVVDENNNDVRQIRPEEISSQILKYLTHGASLKIGKKVTHAVITVPAYFNSQQIDATKKAGNLIGIEVLRTIPEPTAAAIAYGLDKKMEDNQNVLVFDLGGGTYDVSILEIQDKLFDVKCSKGDPNLGGQDFDQVLYTMIIKHLGLKEKVKENIVLQKKLKNISEEAKIDLSRDDVNETTVTVDVEGDKKKMSISRVDFEQALEKKFKKRIVKVIDDALKAANIKNKNELHEIVMVGGSTRIPWVRKCVSEYFNKNLNKLNFSIDADKAVAHGAAILAASLSGVKNDKLSDLLVADVIPMALGIETAGGVMATIIEADTKIPTSKKQTFQPASMTQSSVSIACYQGPFKLVKKNTHLGRFDLHDIGKNFPAIEVTFSVDVNGITTVTAHEKGNNKKGDIVLKNAGSMSDEEKERIMAEFEKNSRGDDMEFNIVSGKQRITTTAAKIIEQKAGDETIKKKLEEIMDETNKVTDINEENEKKVKDLEAKLQTVIQLAGAQAGEGKEDSEGEDEDVEDEEENDDEL